MTDPTATTRLARSDVEFCAGGAGLWRGEDPPGTATDAVKDYVAFAKDLLDAEEKRATGMESRALAVITSSGTLVTLMLALAALATRVPQFRVPGPALLLAGVATGAFVVAGVLAILVNAPWRGWGLRPDCLGTELWERWGKPDDDPQAKVTATRLALWRAAHRLTQRKANLVFAATSSQVSGIFALASAVIVVLSAA